VPPRKELLLPDPCPGKGGGKVSATGKDQGGFEPGAGAETVRSPWQYRYERVKPFVIEAPSPRPLPIVGGEGRVRGSRQI
jgi:hypothetical protein